jgi:hypothetical protein
VTHHLSENLGGILPGDEPDQKFAGAGGPVPGGLKKPV